MTYLIYINKLGFEVKVDLPQNLEKQAIEHGLKQKLNDSVAGVKDSATAEQRIQAVIKQLENGIWSSRGATKSPLEKIALRLAKQLASQKGLDKDAIPAIASNPKVLSKAREILALQEQAKSLDLDLNI